MKRLSLVLLFPLFVAASLMSSLSPAAAGAAVRDVMVHASGDRMWIARVHAVDTGQGPSDQTDIVIRQSGPGQQWKTLATVPARAIELGSRSSQLAVLLADGSWQFIWAPDGASTGAPLPAEGRIRAMADDGENLWAIGAVRGGLAAAVSAAAAATAPSTQAMTTATATAAGSEAATRPTREQMVVFRQDAGAWTPIAEFPPDAQLAEPTADISLAVEGGQPYVAFPGASDGSIRILRLNGKNWEDAIGVIPPRIGERLTNLRLLNGPDGLLVWVSDAKGTGRIYSEKRSAQQAVDLKWVGGNEPESAPAITIAGGYLRLVGLHGGKLFEQRYDLSGAPVGAAAELAIPVNLSDSVVGRWVDGAIIFALAFSVLATLYRRTLQQKSGVELHPPPPAPLGLRLGAGVVDALPVIVTFIVVMIHADPTRDAQERLEDMPALIAIGASLALYLLHTTIAEILTGRTLGKWLFGLATVTLSGTRPGTGQVLVRNLLRVLDLLFFPLLLVVISPLRQRSADIAAGTMVARVEDLTKADDAVADASDEHRGSGSGGADSGKDAA